MASAGSTGANDTANDASRIPCTKIFIQRDFSDGTSCRFSTKFPPELENKVDRGTYENTLNNLNQLYAEAERIECKTLCEGWSQWQFHSSADGRIRLAVEVSWC